MRPLTLQPHDQLCLTLLISHHPRPFFNLEPSFSSEPELKTTLVEIYCGNGSNIRKASSGSCGDDSRTAHQNWESGISWKISRAYKLFRRSQNWSCNSSRILAITREVEKGFCTNSSYLSSEKYCWNSISSD